MSAMVECCEHGKVRAAFVCSHSVETLTDGIARGFIWSRGEESKEINAYCKVCEVFMDANGGEWTEDNDWYAGVKLVCEGCALDVAAINNVEVFS